MITMTKTTFLGYVPPLKIRQATIVNGRAMKSKGGSIAISSKANMMAKKLSSRDRF